MPSLSNPTPVKVRGKRRGCLGEKWHIGKQRRSALQRRPQQHNPISAASQSSSGPRKHRRKESDSPLEALPAEVLQQIFQHAANIELPTVSRQLALKLSKSQHLHHELTTRLLEPVLSTSRGLATSAESAAATRLLNSRFMTLTFFGSWLRSHATTASRPTNASQDSGDCNYHLLWSALEPSPRLLPPRKLMSPPFTQEKAKFLSILAQDISDISAIDAEYGELAQESLLAAVEQCDTPFVAMFLSMGVKSSTDLLRVAVVDAGCQKDVVQMLVKGPAFVQSHQLPALPQAIDFNSEVDLLDPVLWSWGQKQGNGKGRWLTAFLKEEQRLRESLELSDNHLQ